MRGDPIYLTWLNSKGGFEYFFFTAQNMYQVDVEGTGFSKVNILPQWPKSYGRTADTIRRQSYRVTRNTINLRSQHLNLNQMEVLSYIKSSSLVQIVYSRKDRRTVIVDDNSFKKYDEQEKALFSIQFSISYTDEIPSQRI